MIRRFFTRILMVALLAACGYNGWQVRQLQAEVGQLKTQVAALPGSAAREPGPAASGLKDAPGGAHSLRVLRARAERFRRRADALWRGDWPAARRHSL